MNPPVRSKAEDATPELLPCPGKRLREAREAIKMNLVTAAEQLHLSQATVEALEAEDFEKLPARVFVRGYYRNYARLVGVSEETINREFNERCPEGGECKGAPPAVKNVKSEMRSSHGLMRIITWSLIATLVVMLAWWAKNNIPWLESAEKQDEVITENQGVSPMDEEASEAPEISPEKSLLPALEETEPVVDKAPAVEPPVETNSVTIEEPAVDTHAMAAQSTPADVPSIAKKPKTKSEIKVEFTGDCWVDIRDASRQFKLVGTMRAGDSRKLGGKAPFSIVLGDYTVVKMTIDGKLYDLSAHGDGKTAKFKLDPVAVAAN